MSNSLSASDFLAKFANVFGTLVRLRADGERWQGKAIAVQLEPEGASIAITLGPDGHTVRPAEGIGAPVMLLAGTRAGLSAWLQGGLDEALGAGTLRVAGEIDFIRALALDTTVLEHRASALDQT